MSEEKFTPFTPKARTNLQGPPRQDVTCGRCGRHHVTFPAHYGECKGRSYPKPSEQIGQASYAAMLGSNQGEVV